MKIRNQYAAALCWHAYCLTDKKYITGTEDLEVAFQDNKSALYSEFPEKYHRPVTILGFNILNEIDFIQEENDGYGPTTYFSDYNHEEGWEYLSLNATIQKLDKFGSLWFAKALEKVGEEISGTMASREGLVADVSVKEDVWEPLRVDRLDDGVRNRLEEIEKQLAVIEGDNGYATTEPDERNGILIPAKASIKAMKESVVSSAVFQATVVGPMKYLSKKFADASIGLAAKKILDLVIEWMK